MLNTLRRQYRELLLNDADATPLEECRALLDRLDDRGRFPDLDYTDRQCNEWQVRVHFQRMVRLLSNRAVLEEPALRARAMTGLDFWLDAGFENPNWWHNEIGQPQDLGAAALLLEPWLTPAQRDKIRPILERGSLYTRPELYRLWKGANLLWGVVDTLQHALFQGEPAMAAEALAHAARELTAADNPDEGIQPDYSFFQHHTQLYSGGYGRSFVVEFSRILYILRGTPLQLPAPALRRLADFVLEGEQWMLQGDAWDFTVIGREIVRPEGIVSPAFTQALRRLTQVEELPRREELAAFYRRLAGEGAPLEGDRAFPCGRLYVSHRRGRYLAARVTDPGQMLGETINGENFYSANLYAGGVTCLMGEPAAYDRLPPVWHPCFVPGTTARVESDEALMDKRSLWHGRFGGNRAGRVVSLAPDAGAAFQDIDFNGITGVLARLFLGGTLVALGAGLTAQGPEPVVTTLDQCRRRQTPVRRRLPRGEALYADGFLYAVLDGQPLQEAEETRTGAWSRINVSCGAPPETVPVRTLWLAHGAAPAGASYAYAVVPGEPAEAEAALAALTVLANTPAVQAVRWGDRVLAVFHEAASLTLPDGRVVTGTAADAALYTLA